METFQKLLCHFDSDVQDDSGNEQTMTASGSAAISEDQAKFGDASLKGTAEADIVTVPDSADWHFGDNDFTIDFWYRRGASMPNLMLAGQYVDINNYWFIYGNSGVVGFLVRESAVTQITAQSTTIPAANTWTHIAATRIGTDWKIWVDGVVGATAASKSYTVPNFAADLIIRPTDDYAGDAYIDELRILNGQGFWNNAFNPPTIAWVDNQTSRRMIQEQSVFLDEFGEVIQYVPASGSARSIKAIVDRDPPAQAGPSGFGTSMTITVANDATIGITPQQADAGGDSIDVPARMGGPVQRRLLKFHQYQDDGFVEFAVM
tara:strand:+ start:5722 stop:6678 length:957 start_codon:yes stop_codon:yes gene_type:complete